MIGILPKKRSLAARQLASVFLLNVLFFIPGCATVPITGRSQVNVIPDAQLVSAADQTFSRFMGLVNQKNLVMSGFESPRAASTVAAIRRVSDRIIDAAGLRGRYKWETVVVKAKEPNAFVMPNGKIVVFTGLLPVAKTEAGLAAVIAHEVSHVVARHQAERVSQMLLAKVVLTAADIALATSRPEYGPVVGAALGLGAQYGVLLPFSREHESEADHIGLFYMAKAGYDPSEAIGLWERMEAAGGSGPWEFISTHPSPATRRSQLRDWLPEAKLYYADRTRPLPTDLTEVQAARAEHASKMALAPIGPQPLYQTGFWYRSNASNRTTPVTYRFVRREACAAGECMVIEGDSGVVGVYTPNFEIVEVRNPNGSWLRFSPPLRLIRWPVRVGDTWSGVITIEQSSGRRQSGQMKADVLGYEEVKVPAGTFLAFKIIVSLGGIRYQEIWYAPETRTFVRAITYDRGGGQVISELIDYQRSNEPVGPIKPD
jgi:Zn-dependent protease with chaperone function